MRLTVVGSAPAYSKQPGHASSCYLVEHGTTSIAFDFGQGAFAEMFRYGGANRLDAIVISHMHADHCVDLVPMRHYAKFERGGVAPALYGPLGLRPAFGTFQADDEFLSEFGGAPLEVGSFTVGELSIETRRVTHIPDSFAFRVSALNDPHATGLVYTGDCGEWQDLAPLIRPGDVVLSEAAFGTTRPIPGIHLTGDEAAYAAAAGEASRLLLTHLLERYDEAATVQAATDAFGKPVEVARPGLTVDIG